MIDMMKKTHRELIHERDAARRIEFEKRWPVLPRSRLMSDAQIKAQAARYRKRKVKSKVMPCELCLVKNAKPKRKYCEACEWKVLRKLEECGYLQRLGDEHVGMRRTAEAMQEIVSAKTNIPKTEQYKRIWN